MNGGSSSCMTNTNTVILDLFNAVPNLYVRYENSKDRLHIQGLNIRIWSGPLGLVGSHLHIFPVWLTFSFWGIENAFA